MTPRDVHSSVWGLDAATYVRADSELERRFLRLARAAGLPRPETQAWVNGLRVDFFRRELSVLRFTHGQVVHEAERVREVLRRAACP